jgi:hypothetical protein
MLLMLARPGSLAWRFRSGLMTSKRSVSRSRAGPNSCASHLNSVFIALARSSPTTMEESEMAARSRRSATRI